MIEISQGAGGVVADDVRATIKAFDNALLNTARMCASFIEATADAGVPVAQSQGTLKSIASGMASVVDGRAGIVEAVRHMLVIKKYSSIAWEDYGCPTGVDGAAPTQKPVTPTVVAAAHVEEAL